VLLIIYRWVTFILSNIKLGYVGIEHIFSYLRNTLILIWVALDADLFLPDCIQKSRGSAWVYHHRSGSQCLQFWGVAVALIFIHANRKLFRGLTVGVLNTHVLKMNRTSLRTQWIEGRVWWPRWNGFIQRIVRGCLFEFWFIVLVDSLDRMQTINQDILGFGYSSIEG
jgi:hypothetical protein